MKPKTMILMVVAVVCGLGASYMTSKLLAERGKNDQAEPTVPVLVATARIAAWQPIKEPEKFFEVRQFPVSVAPPKALDDLEKVKDKRLNKLLDVGKPVTEGDLLTKEQMSIVESLLPGQRAIAIKVTTESLVAGFVLPGTRVDVVCTTRGGNSAARIILQNMLVLAVDTQDQRPTDTKTIAGQTVTLAATPEESTRLSLAQSIGELRLLLKSGGDSKHTYEVVSTEKDLARPLSGADDKEREEARAAASPTVTLPTVPLEEPKVTPRVEEKIEPKKRKRHVMTIVTAGNRERAVFLLGDEDVDENVVAPKKDKDDAPKAAPTTAATGKAPRAGRTQ